MALKIGVVGYSRPGFDHTLAKTLLAESMRVLLARWPGNDSSVDIVSGLTDTGIPRIAYRYAVEHGFRTTGLSTRAAFSVASGVFPVDQQIIEGEIFGDESQRFVDHIDCLIRIGGGTQSHREVALFRARCAREGWPLSARLIEHELAHQT